MEATSGMRPGAEVRSLGVARERKRIDMDERELMGKHSAPKSSRKTSTTTTTEPQITKDPADPKYDQPKTFGKGWNR
jgi:hypothetical protein